jgi:hypothetical protein
MLGEVIGEFRGSITTVRALSEGQLEISEQAAGSILGMEA